MLDLAGKVMTSFSLLLLSISAPLVLCCDRFDRGSRQVKRDPVDLVTEDYDLSLGRHEYFNQSINQINLCPSAKYIKNVQRRSSSNYCW